MRYWYTILLILGISSAAIGQSSLPSKYQKIYNEAEKHLRKKAYDKAQSDYEKVLKQYPNHALSIAKIGAIKYALKSPQEANDYFEKSLLIDSTNAKVWLSSATVHRELKEYLEAAHAYQKYIDLNDGDVHPRFHKLYETMLFTDEAMKNKSTLEISPLDSAINSKESEYILSSSLDGSVLIFTRRHRGQEDLYEAIYKDDSLVEVRPLKGVNTYDNEGAHSLSASGNTLFFTYCNEEVTLGNCDLFLSRRKSDGWSKPLNLGARLNSYSWDAQPSISADGNTLYFSSKRKGGLGGADLWYVQKDASGRWEEPKNMGPTINTPNDDESPFIHPDNLTLYFRSSGHVGLGGQDLFVVKREHWQADWGEVQNLGYPINSSGSEGGLTVSLDGKFAYYSRDLDGEQLDIVRFDLPPSKRAALTTYLALEVINADDSSRIQTDVIIKDLDQEMNQYHFKSSSYAAVTSPIVVDRNYALVIDDDRFQYISKNINLDSLHFSENALHLTVAVYPIEMEEKMPPPTVLENIFFETGSAELLPTSISEIQDLANYLNKHPQFAIQINGHTDNVGSHADNVQLSKARAESVKKALVEKGIQTHRISTHGYGEEVPIATNDTAEGRSKNRRTEFQIIKK